MQAKAIAHTPEKTERNTALKKIVEAGHGTGLVPGNGENCRGTLPKNRKLSLIAGR